MMELFATFMAGLVAGAMTFVSAVDTRTLLELDEPSVKKIFPVWWPFGKQLMVPLLGITTFSHVLAFVSSSNVAWLISGSFIMLIGIFTGVVLREDIAVLRKASSTETRSITAHFCMYHHFRLFFSIIGFVIALVTLSK